MTEILIASVITMVGTATIVYFVLKSMNSKNQVRIEEKAEDIEEKRQALISKAHNDAKRIVIDAKAEALKIKQSAERSAQSIRSKSLEIEKKADKRFDDLYKKVKEVEDKEQQLRESERKLNSKKEEVEKLRQSEIQKLEAISSLTREEAKQRILAELEQDLENGRAKKIKEFEERFSAEVDEKAKNLLVDAMHHASTDYVAEYTISTVKLTDKDLKGRIIGKEGRNIKAFEDATGVNVDFDNEDEVRLSSFDAVRREIARISLEKLLKDGRIQPARIEEVVNKTTIEVDKIILKAGNDLCQTVGVYNLPKELVSKLGNFKYRTSYGQNMIQHTLEETKMGVHLANEIGADVTITKLACLLHDIGKVVTDKDGSHIDLGVDYLKKFNLPKSVITAVEEHHEDSPSSVEGVLVQIADSISGSRPGARYEDYENYVQRMKDLEAAAEGFEGVDKVFAISAGRELRVIVKPDQINDNEAVILSEKISKKIEDEQTFPGTVKIVVVRETRTVATAA